MLISSIKKRIFLCRCHLVSSQLFWTIFIALAVPSSRVTAQIIPDRTLPNNSIVVPNGKDLMILGGSRAGGNLFHSFTNFSIPTGNTAFFNNALDIQNIITRVTGNTSSNLDGTLKANGTANLFFLNPYGINFGTHAALNIGGSFLGSTANRISFADGTLFSATNPQNSPLLTISTPIGLQFSQNSGAINVAGMGHNLTIPNPASPRFLRGNNSPGLQVAPGQSLALIGNNINLQGAVLMAPGGRIELGSVSAGNVNFNSAATGWSFDYPDGQIFADINLSQQALLDASNNQGGGFISVQGRNVTLNDGSVILIENQGIKPTGNISINASESVQLSGISSTQDVPSSLLTQSVAAGNGGDINIVTKRLFVQSGAIIDTTSFNTGKSGDININAAQSVEVSKSSVSNIGSATYGSGNAGDLTILTNQLSILQGARITDSTFSSGSGGKFTVSATTLDIIGTGADTYTRTFSFLGVINFGPGNSGNLIINTSKLTIDQGGQVSSATYASGNAGDITINALKSVEVNGQAVADLNPSQISASAQIADLEAQKFLGLPTVPSGKSGTVTINTPQLSVLNGGLVNVTNQGLGSAGTLNINAASIFLDNAGEITATTTNGKGGNIMLQGQNIQLQGDSSITATAGGNGNGGNLYIDTNTVELLENSNIIANAVQGRGGNINITTQGLFLSPNSNITASSQFGVSGTININNPAVNPSSGLVILPDTVQDPTHQVVVGCAVNQGNSLTVTGLGGLPEDPTTTIRGQTIWQDWQDFSAPENPRPQRFSQNSRFLVPQQSHQLVEATGWVKDAIGKIKLVADPTNLTGDSPWLKPFKCNGI